MASIKVMDALFGLVARNDAEWSTSFIFIVTKLVLCYIAVTSAVITRVSAVIKSQPCYNFFVTLSFLYVCCGLINRVNNFSVSEL